MKKIRLSFSALEKYKLCSKMYQYHYIDKIRPISISSALVFGNAIDNALNELLENKRLDSAINVFQSIMRNNKDKNIDFYMQDIPPYVNNLNSKKEKQNYLKNIDNKQSILDFLLKKGIHLLGNYNTQVIPLIEKVESIQTKIIKKNQYGDSIVGAVDFIAKWKGNDNLFIVDNKTSSSSYSKKKIDESIQLSLYAWALGLEDISYIVMRKDLDSKEEIRPIQILNGKINNKIVDYTLQEFDIALSNIKNGCFEKTEDMNTCKFMFGKKCPYFDICHNGKSVGDCKDLKEVK